MRLIVRDLKRTSPQITLDPNNLRSRNKTIGHHVHSTKFFLQIHAWLPFDFPISNFKVFYFVVSEQSNWFRIAEGRRCRGRIRKSLPFTCVGVTTKFCISLRHPIFTPTSNASRINPTATYALLSLIRHDFTYNNVKLVL